jgi:UDP-N-acetylmuramyl pentapeptide phosphotransferase/UDP-N-acetylglucosamine-1-phosphate transferase
MGSRVTGGQLPRRGGGTWSRLLPATMWGRWATGLLIAVLVFFGATYVLIATGQRPGETFTSNLTLSIPGLLAGVCAIGAFATGLIAVIFRAERSPLVFLATLVGLLAIVFFVSPGGPVFG